MEKIQMHVENTIPSLIVGFSEMPLKDLEHFIRELNALAIRKRLLDKGKQDKMLLRGISLTELMNNLDLNILNHA